MDDERADSPVLVGVGNPEAAQQLFRTAADLARLRAGRVWLVTVAVKPHDSPFGVFADETIVDDSAAESHALLDQVTAPEDVTLEREVVAARSVAKGLLAAVEETDPVALVVGRHGRRTEPLAPIFVIRRHRDCPARRRGRGRTPTRCRRPPAGSRPPPGWCSPSLPSSVSRDS
ncbi:MAG: universal stress protein [Haloglomus sp.]